MSVIRRAQMDALSQAAQHNFENEMVRHMYEFSPAHCDVIGEGGVRSVISLGIARAGNYGFNNRGPVRFYLDLMFMFGSDFDSDPQLPWATAILNDEEVPDQMMRAERLYSKSMEYVEAVAGPNHRYAKEAFRQAHGVRYEDLRVPGDDFEAGSLTRLNAGHPHKYAYVGEPPLRQLIQEAIHNAHAHSVSTSEGVLLVLTLMFAMGHGCVSDPLFPWVAGTLNNAAISDPNRRAERLYAKTMLYLDHVIAHLKA